MTTVVLGRAHLYRYFHHTTILWNGILPPTSWPPSLRRRVAHLPPRGRKPTLAPSRDPPNVAPRAAGRGGLPGPTFMISSLEMEDHTYLIIVYMLSCLSYCSFLNLFLGFLAAFDRLRNLWLVPPKWSRLVQSARQGGSNGYKQIPQWS